VSTEFSADGHIDGMKYSCIFNKLQYFHVAVPALPQRLDHDIFEGVVQYGNVQISYDTSEGRGFNQIVI